MADEQMSVDDLMKPENEAELANILDSEFKEAVETTEDSDTSDQKKDTSDQTSEGEDQKASNEDEKSDQTSNQKHDETGKPTKEDRISELLRDRNEAKEQAAKEGSEKDELLSRLEELESRLAVKEGKTGEDDESFTDDQSEITSSKVKELIEQVLSEKNKTSDAEKSIANDITVLSDKKGIEHAVDFTKEIAGLMDKHSSMSAYAAYRMLQGEGIIPADNEASANSNANKMGTGRRSNSGLRNTKRPEDMTTAELETQVNDLFGKGGSAEGQI